MPKPVQDTAAPPNTTCDIYRAGNAPPANPDVAAVYGSLRPNYPGGTDANAGQPTKRWTHVLLVPKGTDVRDHYTGAGAYGANPDTIYVPDKNGTAFKVVFVERRDRGTATDHLCVFLDRQAVTWPSQEL
jgi:hypothetical protein